MIVFDLVCQPANHRFEGWFASSEDFAAQSERGLVTCPQCGSPAVTKAPMAPSVARKGNQRSEPNNAPTPVVGGKMTAEAQALMTRLASLQGEALKQSTWVGGDFAEQSRAMHYGERDAETIHGQATIEEARDLLNEGIPVLPLPFPVTPPDELN
ncbi:MAG: DUF1178 family protein [Sphingomonadales bacterium]|nr:DUF1178 family protein [Sphingomonadales bacterium]